MANYRNDFADVNLETGTICRNFMNHSIGSGDALGDRFGVRVFRNGEPVSLGGTCAGYFVRNTTGETVVISSGVVSGNEAYITLPAACYAVEGSFTLAIKVTSGSETVTMRIIDGVVSRTNTSVTVDPGTLVPSIETLISAINSAVGQIPVNYNASFAPEYSASSTYAVGEYVVYDGYLWRCTTAITETESWTAAHWKKVPLASDVSDLKSALDTTDNALESATEDIYDYFVMSPTSTSVSNFGLSDDGFSVSKSGYKLYKYAVSAGEKYKIVSTDKFQFQNSSSVPSSGISNRVGITYGAGNFFVEIPTNVTYIIVSALDVSTPNIVYHIAGDLKTILYNEINDNRIAKNKTTGDYCITIEDTKSEYILLPCVFKEGEIYQFTIQNTGATLDLFGRVTEESTSVRICTQFTSSHLTETVLFGTTYNYIRYKANGKTTLTVKRVMYYGTGLSSFDLLKTDQKLLNKNITNLIEGKYISTSGSTVTFAESTDSNYGYMIVPCDPGTTFRITGKGGNSPRLWAFIDSAKNILEKAASAADVTNIKIIAPNNTTAVIFNVHIDLTWSITIGENVTDQALAKNQGSENSGKVMGVDSNGNVVPMTISQSDSEESTDYLPLIEITGQTAVPVEENAISYSDFITSTWDTLVTNQFPKVEKSTIMLDTSGTYPIYKYVITPKYYKRTIMLTAGMHGNEWEGFWGLFRLVKYILENGYKSQTLRQLLHDCRMVIIPVMNPYGVQHNQRYGYENWDPNWNYGVNWNVEDYGHRGYTPFSIHETLAVLKVLKEYDDISYYMECHVDPYFEDKGACKGPYVEAVSNSPTFSTAYNMIRDIRQVADAKHNITLNPGFDVWTNKVCSSFLYMEKVRYIPANIIEISIGLNGTGCYLDFGEAETMDDTLEWYGNYLAQIVKNDPKIASSVIPKVTEQPENYSGAVGSTVSFHVVAPDASGYQWTYNNTNDNSTWRNADSSDYSSSSITDTLTFTATSARNGYRYRCLILDMNGNVADVSDEVTLTVT